MTNARPPEIPAKGRPGRLKYAAEIVLVRRRNRVAHQHLLRLRGAQTGSSE